MGGSAAGVVPREDGGERGASERAKCNTRRMRAPATTCDGDLVAEQLAHVVGVATAELRRKRAQHDREGAFGDRWAWAPHVASRLTRALVAAALTSA